MRPMPQLPDTPPVGKTIPGFDVAVWHGIAGPAGMDPALVTRINGVFNQALQVPAVRYRDHRRAGRRHRRRHAATVRRLHQERAEALAGGRQGSRHQTGIGLSRALTRLGGVDQRFLRAGVRFLRAGVRFFFRGPFRCDLLLGRGGLFLRCRPLLLLGQDGLGELLRRGLFEGRSSLLKLLSALAHRPCHTAHDDTCGCDGRRAQRSSGNRFHCIRSFAHHRLLSHAHPLCRFTVPPTLYRFRGR